MAEVIGLQLNIDTKGSNATLGEVKQDIKAINAELAKTSRNSDAYVQLTNKLSQARAEIGDFKEDLVALHPEKLASSFIGLGQSIAGGFAAAQGAMALFGAESEDVQKQLLKVQGAIALVQGIQAAVQGWAAAQRILNVVIAANPIGAIAIAIVAATAAIVAFIGKSKDDNVEWKNKKEAIDDSKKALHDYGKEADDLDAKAKIRAGKSNEEFEKVKALEKEKKDKLLEIEKKYQDELTEILKVTGERNAQFTLEATKAGERAEKERLAIKELYRKKEQDVLDAKLDADSKAADAIVDKIIEDEKKKAKEAEDAFKKRIEKSGKEWMVELELKQRKQDIQDQQDERDAKAFNDNEALFQDAIKIAEERGDALANIEAKNQADRLKSAKELAEAKISIEQSTYAGLASLGQIFINDSEKLVQFQKAQALVQIGIDTAKAISSLTVNSEGNPANLLTGGLAGIAQFASGMVRILANIANAKKILSGAGSTSAPSLGSTGGRVSSSPPPINNVGIGVTNLGKDSKGDFTGQTTQQVVKAFVVESELTAMQKKVASIVKKSKVG